jgi:DNA-binding Lrp family transcriptional regulator
MACFGEESMKRQKLDLKLIAELMKNSKQSDRELAKKLGVLSAYSY